MVVVNGLPKPDQHGDGDILRGYVLLDEDLRRMHPSTRMRDAQVRTTEKRGHLGCFPCSSTR